MPQPAHGVGRHRWHGAQRAEERRLRVGQCAPQRARAAVLPARIAAPGARRAAACALARRREAACPAAAGGGVAAGFLGPPAVPRQRRTRRRGIARGRATALPRAARLEASELAGARRRLGRARQVRRRQLHAGRLGTVRAVRRCAEVLHAGRAPIRRPPLFPTGWPRASTDKGSSPARRLCCDPAGDRQPRHTGRARKGRGGAGGRPARLQLLPARARARAGQL
jgi:hypothetical protein